MIFLKQQLLYQESEIIFVDSSLNLLYFYCLPLHDIPEYHYQAGDEDDGQSNMYSISWPNVLVSCSDNLKKKTHQGAKKQGSSDISFLALPKNYWRICSSFEIFDDTNILFFQTEAKYGMKNLNLYLHSICTQKNKSA